ncbi:hypothetical protein MIND_01284000 [Mycena indigotica]|uniref:Uncharacterized protein n=1 Tax=Mycena indigotica TaxID=2126181 RepID=A0A8H6S1V9_9AGAR|nr:uncharacterized protein MIND_01284000 [Mycena indigotica]KAF7291394.1 hypothetical protein MIND_01284000 [Mycena indigotica]
MCCIASRPRLRPAGLSPHHHHLPSPPFPSSLLPRQPREPSLFAIVHSLAVYPVPLSSILLTTPTMKLALTLLVGAAVVSAVPAPVKRGVNCPGADKDGARLATSDTSRDTLGNVFAVCTYSGAGPCTYFSDGSFSSGSSQCPKGLPQDATAAGSGASSSGIGSQSGGQGQAGAQKGSISAAAKCPAGDKAGSSLASSSVSEDNLGNALVQCDYPKAGACTYFTDGSFSSGSSDCPVGVNQAGNGGKQTTTTPPPVQTTPPPPPAASSRNLFRPAHHIRSARRIVLRPAHYFLGTTRGVLRPARTPAAAVDRDPVHDRDRPRAHPERQRRRRREREGRGPRGRAVRRRARGRPRGREEGECVGGEFGFGGGACAVVVCGVEWYGWWIEDNDTGQYVFVPTVMQTIVYCVCSRVRVAQGCVRPRGHLCRRA